MAESQTQPELRNMVSDLFGESSDEEDEAKETSLKETSTTTAAAIKNIVSDDDDDLFNSDEEVEVEKPEPKRLSTEKTKKVGVLLCLIIKH